MRVLYICNGNSFRSVVAEALTRKYHPDMEVESAGIDAVDHVAKNGIELLSEKDAEKYVKPSPDQVSARAVEEADEIVCMMPEHRRYLERNFDLSGKEVEVWKVVDPIQPGVSPGKAFAKIDEKVSNLS